MKSYDFEYNGRRLSEFGFIICKFNDDSVETISNGSEITFNSVPTMNGAKHELVNSMFENCIESTFQICKNPCGYEKEAVTVDEIREIMRWLNRKEYHKFKLIDEEYVGIYFEASFNVSRIEVNGSVYGFELEMYTNRPFACREPIDIVVRNTIENGEKTIVSLSDDEGYIYPDIEITIDADGDLEIHNELEDRTMFIKNCKVGEVISVKYPIIESSYNSHKIMDDFNWRFFRIARSYKERNNKITISLPCTIKMKYTPIVKIGI